MPVVKSFAVLALCPAVLGVCVFTVARIEKRATRAEMLNADNCPTPDSAATSADIVAPQGARQPVEPREA
jgi:hypothetical protein